MDTQEHDITAGYTEQLARELEVVRAQRDHQMQRAAALSAQLLQSEAALADLEESRSRNEQLADELETALDEVESAYRQIANLTAELDAVHATVSWRVTSVLRAVRRRTKGQHSA